MNLLVIVMFYASLHPQTITPPALPPPIDATPNCNGVPTLVPGMLPSGSWWSSCGVCYPTQAPTGWPTNEWNTPFPVCKYPTPSGPNKFVSPKAVDPGDDGGAGWCAYCPGDPACNITPTVTLTPTYAYTPTPAPTQTVHYYLRSTSVSVSGSGMGSSSNRYQHYGPLQVSNLCGSDEWWGVLFQYEILDSVDWHFFDMSTGMSTGQSSNSGYNSKNYYMRFNGDGLSTDQHAQQAGFTYHISSNGWGVNGQNFPLSHDVGIEDGTNNDAYTYRISWIGDVCKGRNQPTPTPVFVPSPTPTITTTPPNMSVCSEPEYIAEDPIAYFDDIDVYPGACVQVLQGMDEISINGDIHLVIPTITFCPIYVDIPPFEFMGISVPPVMFLLPIVAYVVRLISRI